MVFEVLIRQFPRPGPPCRDRGRLACVSTRVRERRLSDADLSFVEGTSDAEKRRPFRRDARGPGAGVPGLELVLELRVRRNFGSIK